MKKFLLFAAAALVAVSANAQLALKKDMSKSQAVAKQSRNSFSYAKAKKAEASMAKLKNQTFSFAGRAASKSFDLKESLRKSVKPAQNLKMANTSFRRAAAEEYIATGYDMDEALGIQWSTFTGTSTDGSKLLVKDLIPNCFGFEQGVLLEYTIEDGVLIIQPQLVASIAERGWYIFVNDYDAEDGVIRLEIEDDGFIITQGLTLEYGVFSSNSFDPTFKTYLGYWEREKNCKYRLPGDAPEPPVVMAEPGNTVLFAGGGMSGYYYSNNLAVIPGYTEFTLANGTTDFASGWKWSGEEITAAETEGGEDVITPFTAETKDFTFVTNPDALYQKFSLIGLNEDVESEEYAWGYGHALKSDGTCLYEKFYAQASGINDAFDFEDGTYAIMTTQNPDGNRAFYTYYFSTPDRAQYSMSKIYCYQGKPGAPIYFTGVTLPLLYLETQDDFNLHINIYKCSRSASGKLSIGELIAQSDASQENVVDKYLSDTNLGYIVFDGFYMLDDDGMSVALDYLQIEDEFVIEIDGWDNGTFKGILASLDWDVTTSSLQSTYFTLTGEETDLRAFNGWNNTLFIGLNDATTGYLYTTDATDIKIDNAGGEATVNVEAMLRSVNSETGAYDYRLFIDEILVDGESVEEVPEWLTIGVGNISESGTEFTLAFQAAALPEGVAGRTVTVKFMQEGAFLTVNLTQGEPTGISTVKTTKLNGKSLNYNLAGQRVGQGYKGLVIKDGQKMIVK